MSISPDGISPAKRKNYDATSTTDAASEALALQSPLGGGTADFVLQKGDEQTEPLVHGRFLEHALPTQRVVDKRGGDEIGQHLEIAELSEVTVYFWRE